MKSLKVIMAVIAIIMVSSQVYAGDFRNAMWGMTVQEVKEYESGKFNEKASGSYALRYTHKILNISGIETTYNFLQDKLYKAQYKKYDNDGTRRILNLFNEILTTKYGEGKVIRYNEADYVDYYEKVRRGNNSWTRKRRSKVVRQGIYLTVWETERTKIELRSVNISEKELQKRKKAAIKKRYGYLHGPSMLEAHFGAWITINYFAKEYAHFPAEEKARQEKARLESEKKRKEVAERRKKTAAQVF